MNRYIIVVAGGSGSRMKSDLPKQFLPLPDRPLLMLTLEVFQRYDAEMQLILVLPEAHLSLWKSLCEQHAFELPHQLVAGGATRFHSVKNGLDQVPDGEGVVGVHDGVRPLVSSTTIDRAFMGAAEHGNAIPVVQVTESVREQDESGNRAVNRDRFRLVQTPQCFQVSLLKSAFQQPYQDSFTDDASVLEANGGSIHLVEGNRENIKLTTQADLRLAQALMAG